MLRLKLYLVGLICLFAYLFISSTPPVRAAETCVGIQGAECFYDSDCGGAHRCQCPCIFGTCCSKTVIINTPTPTPRTQCGLIGHFCDFDSDCCSNFCGPTGYCAAAPTSVVPTSTPVPTAAPTDVPCACNFNTGRCNGSVASGCSYGVGWRGCDTKACPAPNNAKIFDKCTPPGGFETDCSINSTVYYCGWSNTCIMATPTGPVPTGSAASCTSGIDLCYTEELNSFFCNDGSCNQCNVRTARIYCAGYGGCTSANYNKPPSLGCTHCADVCSPYTNFIGPVGCSACGGPTAPPDGGGGPTDPPPPPPTDTPTPTPVNPGPWIKLKDSSFISSNSLTSQIPLIPVAYDADDDATANFIIGEAGVVGATAVHITGLNSFALPNTANWLATYTPTYLQTPNSYLSYIKARKQHEDFTDLSSITKSGIYVYKGTGPLAIDTPLSTAFNNDIVIITTGVVNINTDFNPVGSVAIVAGQINFDSTVTQATGIFIADDITTGTTVNQGLKIIGNLVAQTSLTNQRNWSDLNKPVIFIVFDGQKYTDLLPYLSTANYEWRQIQ